MTVPPGGTLPAGTRQGYRTQCLRDSQLRGCMGPVAAAAQSEPRLADVNVIFGLADANVIFGSGRPAMPMPR